jgi:cbb3-type cytochrome oxidase maturation protein
VSSIYLLVPLSLLLVGVAVWAFFWAVNRGQFEELEGSGDAALEEDPVTEDAKPPQG